MEPVAMNVPKNSLGTTAGLLGLATPSGLPPSCPQAKLGLLGPGCSIDRHSERKMGGPGLPGRAPREKALELRMAHLPRNCGSPLT